MRESESLRKCSLVDLEFIFEASTKMLSKQSHLNTIASTFDMGLELELVLLDAINSPTSLFFVEGSEILAGSSMGFFGLFRIIMSRLIRSHEQNLEKKREELLKCQ